MLLSSMRWCQWWVSAGMPGYALLHPCLCTTRSYPSQHKADHGHRGVWLFPYAPPELLCCQSVCPAPPPCPSNRRCPQKVCTQPSPYMTNIWFFRIYKGVVQQECVCLPRPAPSLVLLWCWCNPCAPAPRCRLERGWMLPFPAPISSPCSTSNAEQPQQRLGRGKRLLASCRRIVGAAHGWFMVHCLDCESVVQLAPLD
jgi:hypothetical protein